MCGTSPFKSQIRLVGLTILLAVFVFGLSRWFVGTGGTTFAKQAQGKESQAQQPEAQQKPHTVILKWQPSATAGVRYNVYRGTLPKTHPDKLNSTPLETLTFTDTKIEKGKTYYYVTRSIDSEGRESLDSNETLVKIPAP